MFYYKMDEKMQCNSDFCVIIRTVEVRYSFLERKFIMLQLIVDGEQEHLMFHGFFYSLSFEDKKPFIGSVFYSEESRLTARDKIICLVSSAENGYVAAINDKKFDDVFETRE